MKKLILTTCLTLLLSTANATPIAYITNKAGGQIVFTSEVCVDSNGRKVEFLKRVFTFDRAGTMVEGCYYLETKTSLLMLKWLDTGERSVFRLSDLTPY
jgi:hypothetical protein